jgi:hypothetical protein
LLGIRLALVPHGNQVLGILKVLPLSRTACSRFLLRGLAAPVLHFALVESHAGIVVEWAEVSTSALAPKAAAGVADQRGG